MCEPTAENKITICRWSISPEEANIDCAWINAEFAAARAHFMRESSLECGLTEPGCYCGASVLFSAVLIFQGGVCYIKYLHS